MPVNHTAGPWKVQRTITGESEAVEMTGHNSDGDTKFAVFVEAPAYVLAGVSGTGKAECLANARLIAAAPDMLEALEMAAKLCCTARQHFPKSMHNGDKFQLENTAAAIGKVLANAKGNP